MSCYKYYQSNENPSTVFCNAAIAGFTCASSIMVTLMLFREQHNQPQLSTEDIVLDAAAIFMIGITTVYGLIEGYNVIHYASEKAKVYKVYAASPVDLELGGASITDRATAFDEE